MSNKCCSGDGEGRKDKGGGGGSRSKTRCIWRVVCDKVVCERWCVTKKDGVCVWQSCVCACMWKMVCVPLVLWQPPPGFSQTTPPTPPIGTVSLFSSLGMLQEKLSKPCPVFGCRLLRNGNIGDWLPVRHTYAFKWIYLWLFWMSMCAKLSAAAALIDPCAPACLKPCRTSTVNRGNSWKRRITSVP